MRDEKTAQLQSSLRHSEDHRVGRIMICDAANRAGAGGVCFYRLKTSDFVQTRKMVLMS